MRSVRDRWKVHVHHGFSIICIDDREYDTLDPRLVDSNLVVISGGRSTRLRSQVKAEMRDSNGNP